MSYHNIRIKGIPAPLPTDYDRQVSFTDFEVLNPGEPPRGVDLDAEFNSIEQALDETQDRLRLIQRDDGALRNLSVGRDQLKTEALVGVNPPAPWQPFTQYAVNDSVIVNGNSWFVAEISHVSGAEFDPGNWRGLLDLTPFTTEAKNWANFTVDQPVPEGDGTEFSAKHHRTYADAAQLAAEAAQAGSEDARDLSNLYANAPEDQEVTPGTYSALHHRNKAQAAQGLAEDAVDAAQLAEAGANAAQTGAETAEAGAVTARTGAETARTGAETAQTGAQNAQATATSEADRSTTQANRSETEADRAELAADVLQVPIGQVSWFPNMDAVAAGFIVYSGQELNRETYQDWYDFMVAIGMVIDESLWQSNPALRGNASSGNGSTTFRVPDYNGQSVGSYGAVYLTGDGVKSAGTAGLIRQDEMQRITGIAGPDGYERQFYGVNGSSGALSPFDPRTGIGIAASSGSSGGQTGSDQVEFDSANSPDARTNTYTHGTDVTGVWAGRAFGAVVNVGSADAAQLASDYANLSSQVQQLEDNKLDKVDALGGAGQSWQNMSSERTADVTYVNTTGRPICVSVRNATTNNGRAMRGMVNGMTVAWQRNDGSANKELGLTFIVPDGAEYSAVQAIDSWMELR